MPQYDLGLIIPTYGAFNYAESAIDSALENTKGSLKVLVVDDASPDWKPAGEELARKYLRDPRVRFVGFPENGGLTRSWNFGLNYFNQPECLCDFICCANSDLIFAPEWDVPLLRAANLSGALVGPITNAPGTVKHQDVREFLPTYKVSDQAASIADTAIRLKREHFRRLWLRGPINGFCMLASRETWFSGMYDDEHVFNPRNDKNSKGHSNPTPLMTLNEDELQQRWLKQERNSVICPDSFVFHYRSVSRGMKHAKGQGVRK